MSSEIESTPITELVFYHGGCLDGITAAYCHILYSGHSKNTKYLPMTHNEINVPAISQKLSDVNLSELTRVYVLDFNLDKDCYDYLLSSCHKDIQIVVIDHHKTAKEYIEQLQHEFADKNIEFLFNLNYSGAVLSYVYFKYGIRISNNDADSIVWDRMPSWLKMIHDRDLWQWKYPNTKAFTTALFSKICANNQQHVTTHSNIPNEIPLELKLMCDIGPSSIESEKDLVKIGSIMSEQYDNQIQAILDERGYFEIDLFGIDNNSKGYAVNASSLFSSELGSKLCRLDDEHKYAIVFSFIGKDRIKCSIRSTDDFDCSGIAKYFGGGGHPQASGFSLTMEQFLKYIVNI